jgi:hypothetical protein
MKCYKHRNGVYDVAIGDSVYVWNGEICSLALAPRPLAKKVSPQDLPADMRQALRAALRHVVLGVAQYYKWPGAAYDALAERTLECSLEELEQWALISGMAMGDDAD